MPEDKDTKLPTAIGLAFILYITLSQLEGFISLPLREASSFLSYLLLKITGIGIEQNGTILSTPRMNFDVVPACSGSTTLKVMIFSGIIWNALQRKLSLTHKCLISLGTIPIALTMNALRLSTLVLIGHSSYKPVTGILHEVTGIFAFLLAFGLMIWFTKVLSHSQSNSQQHIRFEKPVILLLLMFLCYFPTLNWIYHGWTTSPLDKYSYIFVIIAGIFLWKHFQRDKTPTEQSFKVLTGLLSLYIGIELLAHMADINILRAANFILFLALIIYGRFGKQHFLKCLPLLAIIFLGMPTSSFMLNKLLSAFINSNIATAMTAKILLCATLAFIWHKISFTKKSEPVQVHNYNFKLLMSSLCICLVISLFFSEKKKQQDIPSAISLSYLLENWIGKNTKFANNTPNLWSRLYQKDTHKIEVIINASGGNRHELHPPEYCLTGAGWELSQENTIIRENGDLKNEITEMLLTKGQHKKFFYHWYSDGTIYLKSYKAMLAEDSLRRLQGKTTNWFLFRIISDSKEIVTEDFLKSFTGSFKSGEEEFKF